MAKRYLHYVAKWKAGETGDIQKKLLFSWRIRPFIMNKIKLPFLTKKAFTQSARELIQHLKPSVHKIGETPGTLTYTGQNTIPTEIKLFQYDKNDISSHRIENIEILKNKLSGKHMNWVNVVGFQDIETIGELGSLFQINQLTMEDILNTSQLPKIEDHEDYVYITLKLVGLKTEENMFDITHYNLIIKENTLITFSEKQNSVFDNLEGNLQNKFSDLRNSTIAYQSYRVVDTIVDHYYYTLEWFSNILSDLETELVENPSKKHIHSILTFKKQWMVLRKAIFPLNDAIRRMMHLEPRFMETAGKHYINDLHDHLQSSGETMTILRETLNNLMDLYNSAVSNKMNEVMQMLTVVATIFIPLTFIAGVYGMNFKNMPELTWENGYYYTLGLMFVIGLIMFLYIKRKRWL